MLYGPFTAALAAGAGDLIKYLLKPDGAYFFGFTLTAMLGGVVYGVFFYREKCTIPRAIASKATVSLLLNCLLNTVWVSWLYGMPFLGALGPRVIKNLMALPFEIVLLYIVLNGMNQSNPASKASLINVIEKIKRSRNIFSASFLLQENPIWW